MTKALSKATKPAVEQRSAIKACKWLISVLVAGMVIAVALRAKRSEPRRLTEAGVASVPSPGSSFLPTIENKNPRPAGVAPEGMVWIPGGEFSMGSDESGGALCGMPGVTRDAQPIHRVFVNGFWMEATEVNNDQLE